MPSTGDRPSSFLIRSIFALSVSGDAATASSVCHAEVDVPEERLVRGGARLW